jgi:hypothetical protein
MSPPTSIGAMLFAECPVLSSQVHVSLLFVSARASHVLVIDSMVLCGLRHWCGRDALLACWCRNAFKRALDRYCGLCITALYFLYISVVKGALSVFDCSKNEDGVRILDADPSIVCDQVCVKELVLVTLRG